MHDTPSAPSPIHAAFIICGVSLVAVLICAGVLYVGRWWMREEFPGQVRADIETNAVIVEHIGAIEELVLDIDATGVEPGENVFVFNVRGSKGGGRLRAEVLSKSATEEQVVSAELLLESGGKHQLFPDRPLP
jgi:hypothetical protein